MLLVGILNYNIGGFNREPEVISRGEPGAALSSGTKPRLKYNDFS